MFGLQIFKWCSFIQIYEIKHKVFLIFKLLIKRKRIILNNILKFAISLDICFGLRKNYQKLIFNATLETEWCMILHCHLIFTMEVLKDMHLQIRMFNFWNILITRVPDFSGTSCFQAYYTGRRKCFTHYA